MDDHENTSITEACMQPPEKITPLLLFLIEHDAPVDVGGLPCRWAVWAALAGNQSPGVIEAMLKKDGPGTAAAMRQAAVSKQFNVVNAFIRFSMEIDQKTARDLRTVAEEIGNADVVKLVHVWTKCWKADANISSRAFNAVQRVKQLFKGRT